MQNRLGPGSLLQDSWRRLMKHIRFILAVAFALIFPISNNSVAAEQNKINDIIGAFNHLTLSLSLMRHGVAAEGIRQDILSNLELSRLSPELQEDYKSLLQLADRIALKEAEILKEHRMVEQKIEREQKKKNLNDLVQLGVAAYTGNPSVLFSLISSANSAKGQETEVTAEKIGLMFRQEISGFEFELALRREQLARRYGFEPGRLIKPADVDDYLKLKNSQYTKEEYVRHLSTLHRKSPALYMVNYELGHQNLKAKNYESAREHFLSVVKLAPSVVRKIPLRSIAWAFIGIIDSQQGACDSAYASYSEALSELPDNPVALLGRATCYQMQKRYEEAISDYEAYLNVADDQPEVNYNFACALSLAGRSSDRVLQQVQRAMRAGYTNIDHAKKDPDLAAVHNLPEFKNLVSMRFEYSLNWNALIPDVLSLTNKSKFNITNVNIGLLCHVFDSTGRMNPTWYYNNWSRSIKFDQIKVNQSIKFNAFDYTKQQVAQIKLDIICDQGHVQAVFVNRGGALSLQDSKAF
jgi:tetratricopeptide (TPR) repeat protein